MHIQQVIQSMFDLIDAAEATANMLQAKEPLGNPQIASQIVTQGGELLTRAQTAKGLLTGGTVPVDVVMRDAATEPTDAAPSNAEAATTQAGVEPAKATRGTRRKAKVTEQQAALLDPTPIHDEGKTQTKARKLAEIGTEAPPVEQVVSRATTARGGKSAKPTAPVIAAKPTAPVIAAKPTAPVIAAKTPAAKKLPIGRSIGGKIAASLATKPAKRVRQQSLAIDMPTTGGKRASKTMPVPLAPKPRRATRANGKAL